MELSGKVISILPLQKGQGKNGEWKKQEYIIETAASQYPKKVCVSVWGDKIDQFSMKEGEPVTVSIEIESREYNGRWYTDVRAWKVSKSQESSESSTPSAPPSFNDPGEDLEELPF